MATTSFVQHGLDQAGVDTAFSRLVGQLTRRGFLAGSVGTAVVGLSGCSVRDRGLVPTPSESVDRWSFVDDRGRALDLPARPRRIAFLADTVGGCLWAAGLRPVAASDASRSLPS